MSHKNKEWKWEWLKVLGLYYYQLVFSAYSLVEIYFWSQVIEIQIKLASLSKMKKAMGFR